MQISRNKKRMTSLALILALTLIIGVVYAVGAGTLTINGSATLGGGGGDIDVKITDVEAVDDIGTIKIGQTSDSDDQFATITVTLDNPGDSAEFCITIKNEGTVAAKYNGISVTGSDALTIDFPATDGTVIAAGASIPESLWVTWDESGGYDNATSGTFTVTINYEQA